MNNELDPFERRLARQPFRQIPPAWRAEILSATRRAQTADHAAPVTPNSWRSTLTRQLSIVFWPHPKAWAGLAAVWVFILVVNCSMRDSSPGLAAKSEPTAPDVLVELKKQQRLLAELVGANDPADADRRKIFVPRPRSERWETAAA